MTGYRYGAFHGGPDPLAAPPDAAAGVDDLAQRILGGQSLSEALRDLMREGTQGRRGLQDMAQRIRERRRRLEQSGRMDGLLEDLRDLLDTALEAERAELFPDPSDDARFREAVLDNVPTDVGRAVQELSSYDWRSDEARAAFDQIRERHQRDVVDQQFRDLTRGIHSMSSPESRQALKEMMADLNQLLEKHQRGENVTDDYRDFIDKHRDFFPDAPDTIEEFIDELARRSAAMQRMLDSMSPEQYTERVIDRTLEFRALAPPLQAAKAASWADHRAQWGISRDPGPLPRPVRVPGPAERAEALEQLDLLVLAEELDRDPHYELAGLTPPRADDHGMRA